MRRTLPAILCVVTFAATAPTTFAAEAAPVPLPQAHAHNDYRHERPLLDALDRGFCSVEADIFLVDGQLLIGHDRRELTPERTLEALYLAPLAERARADDGERVFRNGPPITLLIDIKTSASATWPVLHEMLSRYGKLFTRIEKDRVVEGAVTVVISGNRPFKELAETSPRYAGLDGRMSDIDSEAAVHLMPLISDHWFRHFKWDGEGPMPNEEREKLQETVKRVHASGRRLRFWATPDKEPMWRELHAAGVDLINTDDLEGLSRFLRSKR
jgi:glycerophosphoryl diester phosphodiesterase family protein